MKKTLLTLFTSLIIIGTMFQAAIAQDTLPLKAQEIGKNCKLTNSINVNKDALGSFEKKFGAKVTSLRNDFFNLNGNKLQVNYIESPDSANTSKIYSSMVTLAGNYNVIAQKGNTVIEIISPDIQAKNTVIDLIAPAKVHKNY